MKVQEFIEAYQYEYAHGSQEYYRMRHIIALLQCYPLEYCRTLFPRFEGGDCGNVYSLALEQCTQEDNTFNLARKEY